MAAGVRRGGRVGALGGAALLALLALLGGGLWGGGREAAFVAPAAFARYAEEVAVAEYVAVAVPAGVRLLWEEGGFVEAEGARYAPPAWLAAQMPKAAVVGVMGAEGLEEGEIGRILRTPQAGDAWRKLRFVALDTPDADGGFAARRAVLERWAAAEGGGGAVRMAATVVFADAAALREGLEAMYGDGGDGYWLYHREGGFGAGGRAFLLALPYEVGEGEVRSHRSGRGALAGMMGSLEVVDAGGAGFFINTGFTHAERRAPPPVGARIRYKYRGHTANAKPRSPVFVEVVRAAAAENRLFGVLRAVHVMWAFVFLMALLAGLDAGTHRRGPRRHWDFKSAIVSTGLLGTFVGVFWGLAAFDTSDVAAGVPTLLEGLKLAFVTSIVGIALSTLLSVVQTIVEAEEA